jgi:hypothetical protein
MAGFGKHMKGGGMEKSMDTRSKFALGSSPKPIKSFEMKVKQPGLGLKPIGDIRVPRKVRGELNMLAKGGMAQQAAIAISKKESGKYDKEGKRIKHAKGGSAKPGLWANINRRKRLGISRPKSKSTISAKAYANMKKGFPK